MVLTIFRLSRNTYIPDPILSLIMIMLFSKRPSFSRKTSWLTDNFSKIYLYQFSPIAFILKSRNAKRERMQKLWKFVCYIWDGNRTKKNTSGAVTHYWNIGKRIKWNTLSAVFRKKMKRIWLFVGWIRIWRRISKRPIKCFIALLCGRYLPFTWRMCWETWNCKPWKKEEKMLWLL